MALIRPLPKEVAAKIKSSTIISSLESVVLGLLGNSLDSACKKIDISVDFTRGVCSIEDDGCGIHPADFHEEGGLGKHHRK